MRSCLPFVLPLLLGACDDLGIEDQSEGITTTTASYTADSDGLVSVEVDVADNTDSFMVTLEGEDALMSLESVTDPNDDEILYWEDWYYGTQSLTYAFYPNSTEVVFNWPVRAEDGKLAAGTYTLSFGAITPSGDTYYYAPGAKVDGTLQTKADSKISEGTVKVLVVYADGVGDEEDVVAATESAVEIWREVWSPYGLVIDVTYVDGAIDPALDLPGAGGDALTQASEDGTDEDLTVVIGETIDGSVEFYGVAGSVPGSLIPSVRSAVVVSWLANAGGDGKFSDEDLRIYGETLAHETGHYTGLFHPVGIDFDVWDALDDTPQCGNQTNCESSMGDNNMFPYPVCDFNSCIPQDQLTDDQMGVSQRYTGTL